MVILPSDQVENVRDVVHGFALVSDCCEGPQTLVHGGDTGNSPVVVFGELEVLSMVGGSVLGKRHTSDVFATCRSRFEPD